MKAVVKMPISHVAIFVVFWVMVSCQKQEVKPDLTTPPPTAPTSEVVTVATATHKAVGRWKLATIQSGWTGESRLATQNIELVIDHQLQTSFYEDGKEVLRYQYVLSEFPLGIRYAITKPVGKSSFYLQPAGNFRVTDVQLIIGDTGLDGNDYTFNRL